MTVRVRRGSLFAALAVVVPETTNPGEGERFFFASRLTPGADELERAQCSPIMTFQLNATRGSSTRVPEGDTDVAASRLTAIATVPNPTQAFRMPLLVAYDLLHPCASHFMASLRPLARSGHQHRPLVLPLSTISGRRFVQNHLPLRRVYTVQYTELYYERCTIYRRLSDLQTVFGA